MAQDPAGKSAPSGQTAQRIRYHFIKSNHFRTVLAEGVYGGISPTGKIRMTFFNERTALPQQTEHALTSDGRVGAEVLDGRVSRDGIVRELEVDVVVDIDNAKKIHHWLGQKIDELSKLLEDIRRESPQDVGGDNA